MRISKITVARRVSAKRLLPIASFLKNAPVAVCVLRYVPRRQQAVKRRRPIGLIMINVLVAALVSRAANLTQ
jgi:hypothetical protein